MENTRKTAEYIYESMCNAGSTEGAITVLEELLKQIKQDKVSMSGIDMLLE